MSSVVVMSCGWSRVRRGGARRGAAALERAWSLSPAAGRGGASPRRQHGRHDHAPVDAADDDLAARARRGDGLRRAERGVAPGAQLQGQQDEHGEEGDPGPEHDRRGAGSPGTAGPWVSHRSAVAGRGRRRPEESSPDRRGLVESCRRHVVAVAAVSSKRSSSAPWRLPPWSSTDVVERAVVGTAATGAGSSGRGGRGDRGGVRDDGRGRDACRRSGAGRPRPWRAGCGARSPGSTSVRTSGVAVAAAVAEAALVPWASLPAGRVAAATPTPRSPAAAAMTMVRFGFMAGTVAPGPTTAGQRSAKTRQRPPRGARACVSGCP